MSDIRSLPPTKAMIGKWSVDRYVSLIRRWSIIAAVIVLLFVIIHQARSIIIAVELVMVVWVGWLVHRRDGGKIEALASGSFIGVVLGITASVGRYIVDPNLANGVMIIIETALTTLLSAMVATAAVLLFNLIHQPKN